MGGAEKDKVTGERLAIYFSGRRSGQGGGGGVSASPHIGHTQEFACSIRVDEIGRDAIISKLRIGKPD